MCATSSRTRSARAPCAPIRDIADACRLLSRGLTRVGIIGLVDEATGYQRERAADALAEILERIIAKELQPWVKTFPEEFYEHLFRLRGLSFPEYKVSRPQYFGHLTNDIIYKRLAPGVLEELRKMTPKTPSGRRQHHFFRRLTDDTGHPKLREHLSAVIAVMSLSDDYDDFIEKLTAQNRAMEKLPCCQTSTCLRNPVSSAGRVPRTSARPPLNSRLTCDLFAALGAQLLGARLSTLEATTASKAHGSRVLALLLRCRLTVVDFTRGNVHDHLSALSEVGWPFSAWCFIGHAWEDGSVRGEVQPKSRPFRIQTDPLPLIGLPCLILLLWLYVAGSYSPLRDLVGIVLATLGVTAYRAWRRGGTAEVAAASTWTSTAKLASPLRSFRWLLACWVTLSLLDAAFAPRPLTLRGRVAAPPAMPATSGKLRVGLALSGGGYRAALVHAGVLQELAARGIPVTNIASVSGGSIIGSFVGQGGDPADFVAAVKEGQFRFKRDLLSALNLPRWLFPFGSFSRRDVQAALVRRVLLSGAPVPGSNRPAFMLAMTDLSNAMSVGVTDHGFMLAGPTTSRFFKSGEAMAIDGLGDLADKVAISGAFPGAFPAYRTSARFTQTYEPLSRSHPGRTIPLALVDGGVFDNLGLTLLQTIDQEARGTGNNSLPRPLFQPGSDWALDVIIISDGGQSLVAVEKPMWLLSQAWRAIEVSGMGTGILRTHQDFSRASSHFPLRGFRTRAFSRRRHRGVALLEPGSRPSQILPAPKAFRQRSDAHCRSGPGPRSSEAGTRRLSPHQEGSAQYRRRRYPLRQTRPRLP